MAAFLWEFLVTNWLFIITIALIAHLITNHRYRGLQKYPGPIVAGYTNWWRFFDVLGRRPDITQRKLHQEHGDIIRLGPDVLSFANPKAVKTIYGLNKGFTKSGFYPPQQGVFRGTRLPSLFSTTDESFHANLRRSVNNAFSMTSMVHYEPGVSDVVDLFLKQTERLFASPGKECDFAEWLQYFAFDGIGKITYSEPHGFVEQNTDVEGIIDYLGKTFSYVAPVGQMPFLDLVWKRNPLVMFLDYLGFSFSAFPIAIFAKSRLDKKIAQLEKNKLDADVGENDRSDLLHMFLKAQRDRPEFMTYQRVLTMAVSMAFAGSETTAITLAAVFYYLLRNPKCYEKLVAEIDDAFAKRTIETRPTGVVTWAESQKLPYLDACIKEAFRLHPAAGLPLERVTPPQGIEIDGQFIPGGVIVGCNAWVIHKREEIFGKNVDAFNPERWLIDDKEKVKEMNGTMFQFGAGPRTCIGKNISLLEIYKLVPAFLRRFEIELAHPEKDWKLHNAWFVKQLDFITKFKVRTLKEK